MYDVAVVGAGLLGAAAARHLAEADLSVAVVGPTEPTDPFHDRGPFGAHYDESRLAGRFHPDPVEMELATRTLAAIAAIERRVGWTIHRSSAHLVAAVGSDADGFLAAARASGLPLSGPDEIRSRYPALALPDGATGCLEGPPAGWFSPRALVSAQLTLAERAGAFLHRAPAIGVGTGSPSIVQLAGGDSITARRVLVAAGAWSGRLLPVPPAFRWKTETVLMAELDEAEAARLAGLPAMVYAIDDPGIDDVYAVPPVRYPDGRRLLKWGANTVADRWLADLEEVDAWYREGDSHPAAQLLRPALESTFPGLRAIGWETHRCVVTYTAHGLPYIDEVVPGRLYVAAGGNGRAAKWSDAVGGLAGSLVASGVWNDSLPAGRFRLHPAGEVGRWAGPELLSDRRAGG